MYDDKLPIIGILAFWILLTSLISPVNAENTSVHQQLCVLNQEWSKIEKVPPSLQQYFEFNNHEQLIQVHLYLVENYLRENPPLDLNEAQKANRQKALDILQDYWQAGVFPQNLYHDELTPYFIDNFNTACAVGHIMRESGSVELAAQVAQTHNYNYIADMPFAELAQWANEMGFTVDELKWIQPTYGSSFYNEQTTIVSPSCNTDNGSITSQFDVSFCADEVFGPTNFIWLDINRDTIAITHYDVTLNDSMISDSLENLGAGVYHLFVTDADYPYVNGGGSEICINSIPYSTTYTVSDVDAVEITNIDIQHADCINVFDYIYNDTSYGILYNNIETGSISVELAEEVPVANIVWYNWLGEQIGTGYTIDSLTPNLRISGTFFEIPYISNYTLEITDNNNCKRYASYQIGGGNAHTNLFILDINSPSSAASYDGSINMLHQYLQNSFSWYEYLDYSSIQYSYNWTQIDGDFSSNSDNISNLTAGIYQLEIILGYGELYCSQTIEVPLRAPCFESEGAAICDGDTYEVLVSISGDPESTYNLQFTEPVDSLVQVTTDTGGYANFMTESFPNLTGYQVVISDSANNCLDTLGIPMIDCSSGLSADLLSFEARNTLQGNELSWTTAHEEAGDYFIIERSNDGQNFEVIEQIPVVYTSTSHSQHSFVDKSNECKNYYRLRIQDHQSKKEQLSNVTLVNQCSEVGNIQVSSLFPNPSSLGSTLVIQAKQTAFVQYELLNISGQVIEQKSLLLNEGRNQVNIGQQPLQAGTYFVRLLGEDWVEMQRLVIVN